MKDHNNSDTISLLFAGDFIPPESSKNIFTEDLLKVLRAKDFSIVNMEAPLTNGGKKVIKSGNSFKVSPEGILHIRNGYFNAVSLSNNHIRDFGCQGVNETIKTCEQNNILTVGAGANLHEASKPLRITIKGKKLSFLNFSEIEFNFATENKGGANPFDLIDALNQIKSEKEANDFVILIYHGGLEYHHLPTPGIVKLFKFLVEAGSDCIISHHTHRYSGLLFHNNKPIIYGLGNFLAKTKSKNANGWYIGLIAKVKLENNSVSAEIIPTQIGSNFLTVGLVSESKRQMVLAHITEISEIINDEKLLQEYWDKEYEKSQSKLFDILKSDCRFEYRLRKYFPVLFNPGISQYRLINILNLMRCSSHREQLIMLLERYYKSLES